jgi:rod shape-determining protein MreB
MFVSDLGSKKIAIDLGTTNTRVHIQGRGIVLQEPTVVAISSKEHRVIAVGREAREMLGKVPEGIEARHPLISGGIANYRAAEALLKRFLDKSLGKIRLNKPEIIISVPAGITSVEERAIIQVLTSAGAGKIYLLPEPIAAAIGAGLPINTSSGNMIVNIGGGTAEIAILSLNGIVTYQSKRGAGDAVDNAIIGYMRKQYDLLIGEQMAETVKFEIGSALPLSEDLSLEVRGRNLKTGLPDSVMVTSNELADAIKYILLEIVSSIKVVLENTPPELASDIIDRGIVLSGGTALLRKVDELLTKATGVPVHVVEEPLLCVVKGLATALDNVEELKRSFK